ncbi:MAG: exodeoxyribonuclease VII large subunit [Lentisphaerae bacterium GWF2_45_14]|nr:MAG: exodeoxyribonuclease VII large subunit [Lentisphaerae bacterium GWF2_45_14]
MRACEMETEKVWNVSEVNSAVREILENSLLPFWLQGEVGNLSIHRSGHVYLTLKDERCQIKCVYFGGAALASKIKLAVGMEIELYGKLSVYEVRGEYQFSVKLMRLLGTGALQRRFEELKQRLAAEGLFDESRKKPLPLLPKTIGVVTSPGGAAIKDFLNIVNRRFPDLNIKIYPAPVQGKGAEKLLAKGVSFFNKCCPVDVIVVTRGGGSLEDLWPFNEEILAREIASSKIPVISAVGHEIDFTISDFVADLRAPTPSAAAELVIGRREEFQKELKNFIKTMKSSLEIIYGKLSRRYRDAASSYVFREPSCMLREKQQLLDDLRDDMQTLLNERTKDLSVRLVSASKGLALTSKICAGSIAAKIARLSDSLHLRSSGIFSEAVRRKESLDSQLKALSPMNVLKRGYSVLYDPETGKAVSSPDLPPCKILGAVTSEGTLELEFKKGKRSEAFPEGRHNPIKAI